MVKVKKDLTGMIFGRLTVIERTSDQISETNGRAYDRWLCECSCEKHTRKIISGCLLRKKDGVRSCGCLQKEFAKGLNKKYNTYQLNLEDEYGLYGVGYCSNTETPFYFDMDDYDKIKDYCWSEHINTKDGYHSIQTRTDCRKIRMHYLLVGKYYDHKDRNPLNNRRYNLREASKQENARNHNKHKNNSSGFIGVGWDKVCNKWVAYIGVDKKTKKLGRFVNKEDAIKSRLQAECEYFGEFAPQRHLFEQYKINITPERRDYDDKN